MAIKKHTETVDSSFSFQTVTQEKNKELITKVDFKKSVQCAGITTKLVKKQKRGLMAAILFEKRLWYKCFPVNFVKIIRVPFFTEHLRWLLLKKFDCLFLKTYY